MVVQHNMQAMNANRMLNVTTGAQSKSTEKLSSGYKINRAADDAAGLSISEKMRKQIRGLDQASSNAQDGVSAVQTAEGALTEVHSMLQRMNELAVQAANGTNSESDRQSIQDEIDQLTTEIDRVAETTKFNETYLLKGNAEGTTSKVKVAAHDAGLAGKLTDNGDGTYTFAAKALEKGDKVTIAGKEYTIVDSADVKDYKVLDTTTTSTGAASGDKLTDADGNVYTYRTATDKKSDGTTAFGTAGWYKADETSATPEVGNVAQGWSYTTASTGKTQTLVGAKADAADSNTVIKNTADVATALKGLKAGDDVNIDGTAYKIGTKTDNTTITADDLAAKLKNGQTVTITNNSGSAETPFTGVTINDGASRKVYVVGDDDLDSTTIDLQTAYAKMATELQAASSIGTDKAAKVQNNNDGTFKITQGEVEVADKLAFNLHVGADADMTNKIGVDIESMSAAGLGVKGINIKDETGVAATYAIDAIADAVAKVSAQRSALGAVQNRLEHTIANVDNVVENSTSAESRIRDTDMAEEMVNYSKNNILAQAGQSMLAQANQSNQGVLSLLG